MPKAIPEQVLRQGRVLAFDFGLKYLGVALADLELKVPHPLGSVPAVIGQTGWAAVDQLVQEWRPSLLVVGLPLGEAGSWTPLTYRINKFINRLKHRYQLPVVTVDEAYTTMEARQMLLDPEYHDLERTRAGAGARASSGSWTRAGAESGPGARAGKKAKPSLGQLPPKQQQAYYQKLNALAAANILSIFFQQNIDSQKKIL